MQITRHINHTGRRQIKRSEVQIELLEDREVPEFRVNLKLDNSNLSPEADVYVEAYHRNTSQRFEFGTVAAPIPPDETKLDQIDISGPTLFRVKVVDNSEHIGRLIASAEGISPRAEEDEKNESLMIFRSAPDMGNLTWKMAFEDEKPVLCINSRIPEAKSQLLGNPFFQALILPAAFREVLLFVCINDELDEEEGWQADWLRFANKIAPEEQPDDEDPHIIVGWINEVVAEFSNRHHLCDHLISRMEEQSHG